MSREELEKRILEARYNLVSSKDKETIDILEELAIKALEQEPMLDKIKAEIKEEQSNWLDIDPEWKECQRILQIIDRKIKEVEV